MLFILCDRQAFVYLLPQHNDRQLKIQRFEALNIRFANSSLEIVQKGSRPPELEMNKLKKIISVSILAILSVTVHAQSATAQPVDVMRSNGKIYVVVAVVVTILLGLFLYVFNLDRKISKLEKK